MSQGGGLPLAPAWIEANWPTPPGVRALTTTRIGGVSRGALACWNLATHVGEASDLCAQNRQRLREALALPVEPYWLNQVHGIAVARPPCVDTVNQAVTHNEPRNLNPSQAEPPTADAAVTSHGGVVLAVLTADCLPVVFSANNGRVLGVAHAGWRGLVGGVLQATLQSMADAGAKPGDIQVWLGPCIGPTAFEVGDEVREAFVTRDSANGRCFTANARGRWQADLVSLARLELTRLGVTALYSANCCTYTDTERWYSYRRDPAAGRMATLVWRR